MKKPNILFCIADDASHFGYRGEGYVKTPNIDALAKHGVILENAFTTNPKCAPSRATILAGKHTWELKEGCNHCSFFPDDEAVYPDILEENGYFVGYTGKGWGPGDIQRCGRTRNPAGNEYNAKVLTPPTDSLIRDCDYTENFRAFLNDNTDNKPFCFWYGCWEPHRPYNLGESCDFTTDEKDIAYIPSYLPDNEIVRRDFLDYAYEINWFDKHIGGMIRLLEEKNLLEDTLVLVTSDNGMAFPRIKGQMYEQDFHLPMVAYYKGKILSGERITDLISFVDIAPTFLDLAGVAQTGMSGTSFLNLLKGEKTAGGREFIYFGREKHDVGREGDVGYPVRCIRDQKYLYIRNYEPDRWPAGNPETEYTNCDLSPTKDVIMDMAENGDARYLNLCFGKRPSEELYDITNDAECRVNLIDAPAHRGIGAKLSKRLDEKLRETKDPRYLGNDGQFDDYPIFHKKAPLHSWESYAQGTFKALGPAYGMVKAMKKYEKIRRS